MDYDQRELMTHDFGSGKPKITDQDKSTKKLSFWHFAAAGLAGAAFINLAIFAAISGKPDYDAEKEKSGNSEQNANAPRIGHVETSKTNPVDSIKSSSGTQQAIGEPAGAVLNTPAISR